MILSFAAGVGATYTCETGMKAAIMKSTEPTRRKVAATRSVLIQASRRLPSTHFGEQGHKGNPIHGSYFPSRGIALSPVYLQFRNVIPLAISTTQQTSSDAPDLHPARPRQAPDRGGRARRGLMLENFREHPSLLKKSL